MNTDNFINNFRQQINKEVKQDVHYSAEIRVSSWIHRHSTLVKTIEVAALILGIAAVVAAPVAFPVIGASVIAIAVAGSLIALVAYLALTKLHLMYPTAHSMQSHIFKPGTHGAGRLYYQGDIPILELKCDDPYKAGEAHGYLLGNHLNRILKRLDVINASSYNPNPLPTAREVPNVLKALRKHIPQEYLTEMQGIADGYNKWLGEGFLHFGRKIAVDDLILVHMMPDLLHFQSRYQEYREQPIPARPPVPQTQQAPALVLGCTVAIDKDDKEGFVFGRNMDWPSFDIFGASSLIINRRNSGGKQSTVEVGMPGFAGTLTGMNKEGLSLAMNVCGGRTQEIAGMPAAFYNRYMLENCKSVDDVTNKVTQQSPLGFYHLSVADSNQAKGFHFFQGERIGEKRGDHVIRTWKNHQPLLVTNCRYKCDGSMNESCDIEYSKQREALLRRLFNDARKSVAPEDLSIESIVAAGLALPYVNNSITTHKVVMKPRSKKMQVAFDNAYAGNRALTIST